MLDAPPYQWGELNAYSFATPAIAALTAGMAVCVKINADSTGASTLNWDTKGAKGIKKANGTDVTNLKTNGIYTLRYDGANFILQGEGASGDAVASDLLLGKKATTDAGKITGTLTLTGDAAVGNVLSGKTFYNTDAKTKLTGTGAFKKYASGTGTASSNTLTITGLAFTPRVIILTTYYNSLPNFKLRYLYYPLNYASTSGYSF